MIKGNKLNNLTIISYSLHQVGMGHGWVIVKASNGNLKYYNRAIVLSIPSYDIYLLTISVLTVTKIRLNGPFYVKWTILLSCYIFQYFNLQFCAWLYVFVILFPMEENGSYLDLFSQWKILFLPRVVAFWNLVNTYNFIYIVIPRKSTLKPIFSSRTLMAIPGK